MISRKFASGYASVQRWTWICVDHEVDLERSDKVLREQMAKNDIE